MDEEYVAEVAVLSQLERRSQRTMYNMRGYAMSEDKKYLELGRQDLEKVKESLAQAKQLADKFSDLVKLKANVGQSLAKVAAYEDLARQTVDGNEKLAMLRLKMDEAAGVYMNNCNEFLAGQNETMNAEIEAGASSAKLGERLAKITLVNDIIDLGNDTRVKNFKSQATWDPALIEAGLANFAKMDEKFSAPAQDHPA